MPRTVDYKQRLLLLERIFREETDEEHRLSIGQIQELLARKGCPCERKVLYNDINALRQSGMDIVSDLRARNSSYFLGGRDFEEPELYLLANAVASSRFISERKSKQLISKIASLTCRQNGSRLMRQIIVSDRVKSNNESIYYNINTVNAAITEKKKISFLYFNYDEKKRKVYHNDKKPLTVSPKALVWQGENYYAVAYYEKRGTYVNFRADKMEKAEILEEAADKDPDFDVNNYCRRLFGMYGGYGAKVTIRADNELAGVMMEQFGKRTPFALGDGYFEFEADLDVSPVFFGWLSQFGGRARITAPEKVRREFEEFALNVLNSCRGDGE